MKTRIFTGLLCLCLMLLSVLAALPMQASALPQAGGVAPWEAGEAWDGTSATAPSGTGTEEDPYRIGSAAEFAWMNKQMTAQNQSYFAGKYFVLTSDIDCGGKQLRIGTSSKSFAGVFDGNGHTVYNNQVTQNSTPTGLFAYVKGGTVKNLNVTSSTVFTYYADADTKGTAGTIVGSLENGKLIGCTAGSDCTVRAASFAGGLVGTAKDSEILYCVNNATTEILPNKKITVSGSETDSQANVVNYSVGGILAWSAGGNQISDCANYGKCILGNITGGSAKNQPSILTAGGIIGYHTNGDSVTDSYNNGAVSGDAGAFKVRVTVGGIAGRTRTGSATMERCFNLSTNLTATGSNKNCGLLSGFVNANTTLTVKNCQSVAVEGIAVGENNSIVVEKDDSKATAVVTSENNTIATAEAIGEKVAAIHSEIKSNRVARVAIIGMQATEAVGGVCSVRILLGLDGLAYDFYKIKTTATYEKDGETQTAQNGGTPLTMAFDTVYVAGSPVSAVQFGSDYLGAMVIENVPADVVIEFGIQAYIGTGAEDGTLVDSVICRLGEQ